MRRLTVPTHVPRVAACVRKYVTAFYRFPPKESIPTHAPTGEEIDGDVFLDQLRGLTKALHNTTLVDGFCEMKSMPYFDSMFTADLAMSCHEFLAEMPPPTDGSTAQRRFAN